MRCARALALALTALTACERVCGDAHPEWSEEAVVEDAGAEDSAAPLSDAKRDAEVEGGMDAATDASVRAPMTFFVSGQGMGNGDLGGVTGADDMCQRLAFLAGAGDFTWHAYLSTREEDSQEAIDARDRIGLGPWHNFDGVLIAEDLDQLHEQNGSQNQLNEATALTEQGARAPADEHDVFTGSTANGTLFVTDAGLVRDCARWRNGSSDAFARVGHSDRRADLTDPLGPKDDGSWNSAHNAGCDLDSMDGEVDSGARANGRVYCFAVGR